MVIILVIQVLDEVCLKALLFLVYTNDLERNIRSTIKLFAGDSMLFSIVKNPGISTKDVNQDLGVIRQAVQTVHRLCWGTVVAKMNDQKHLGLILQFIF